MTTAKERLERLAFTERAMTRTFSRRRVEQEVGAQYGARPRTVRRYMRAVRRQWAIRAQQDPEAVRVELLGMVRGLYEMALEQDDLGRAVQILSRIAEMMGLDREAAAAPATIVIQTSPEQGRAASAKLRALSGGKK